MKKFTPASKTPAKFMVSLKSNEILILHCKLQVTALNLLKKEWCYSHVTKIVTKYVTCAIVMRYSKALLVDSPST